jgi:hypothetical protein
MMPKRTASDVWQNLVDEAGEDAIERAASAGVGHAERQLREAGFDVAAERAQASALLEQLASPSASGQGRLKLAKTGESEEAPEALVGHEPTSWVSAPPPRPARSSSARSILWLWAAVLAAATTGGVLYALGRRSKPHDVPHEVPARSALPQSPPAAPSANSAARPAPPRLPQTEKPYR